MVDETAVGGVGVKRTRAPVNRKRLVLRLSVLVALLIVVSALGYRFGWFDAHRIATGLERMRSRQNPWIAGSVFVVVASIGIAIGFPALPFTIAGGAIFGQILGTGLSWTAGTAGSVLGYLLARGVGRETARRWLAKRSVGEALTADTSFWTLLRVRLIPVIPLSVVNFAAGLAQTRLASFTLATAIGILPATAIYAFFADSLVSGLGGARAHALRNVAIASVILIVLSLAPLVVQRVTRTRRIA